MSILPLCLLVALSLSGCKHDEPMPPIAPKIAPVQQSPQPVNKAGSQLQEDALTVAGQITGYSFLKDEMMARGSRALIRRENKVCPSLVPRAEASCPTYRRKGSSCTSDGDCSSKRMGHCYYHGMMSACACQYGCTRDSECAQDQICVCDDPVGYCAASSCGESGICEGEKLCAASDLPTDVARHGPFSCATEGELMPKKNPSLPDEH
jgi:hypothetical protein